MQCTSIGYVWKTGKFSKLYHAVLQFLYSIVRLHMCQLWVQTYNSTIHECDSTHTGVCMCTCARVWTCAHVCVHVQYVWTCMLCHVCMYALVYVFKCTMCMYMCLRVPSLLCSLHVFFYSVFCFPIFQVGSRARKPGEYGGCFLSSGEAVVGRPGLRLWLTDNQGKVSGNQ